MHGLRQISGLVPDTSNFCNLGNNSNQTTKEVVDLAQGDDDSMFEEPCQVPKEKRTSSTMSKIPLPPGGHARQRPQQRLPTSTVNAFWREQGRQVLQYRQERFETTARHIEAEARDELQSAIARVNVGFQCNMNARTITWKLGQGPDFLSIRRALISQFASEPNRAFESQREFA